MKLTPRWLILLSIVLCAVGGIWGAASEESGGNLVLPYIVLFAGVAIFLVIVVVFWVAFFYRLLTGKRLQDIGGPVLLAPFFTAFGAGAAGGSEGDGGDGGGFDFGGGG